MSRQTPSNVIGKVTPGFSGADLANLINEGAILAARRNKKTIGMSELEEAIDTFVYRARSADGEAVH